MDTTMREISKHRINGETWDEVARKLGGTAESRRKQYHRGMDEIAKLLGIDGDDPMDAAG
jgi:hypothetical protein